MKLPVRPKKSEGGAKCKTVHMTGEKVNKNVKNEMGEK